ncbi:MAG TPA: hypothetical protein VL944_01200 [Candidatus Acidoferrum sp.]|nr:hypothetical protein [Candidatus Acidoferrum sp.]
MPEGRYHDGVEGGRVKKIASAADVIDSVMDKYSDVVERGKLGRLEQREVAGVLAAALFEVSRTFPDEALVRVRDYDQIAIKGPFKYAGQVGTMKKEGLIPDDVYEGLVSVQAGRVKAGDESHVGPSYLKVKGLMTNWRFREFAGRQAAFVILDHLIENPPQNRSGYIVAIPNMTGGAQIGDEIGKQLHALLEKFIQQYPDSPLSDLKVWPGTPYMRAARKETEIAKTKPQLNSLVEGFPLKPAEVAVILVIEELRTASETTQNARRTYEEYGYSPARGVDIYDVSFFDYRHPVGVQRAAREKAPALYVVPGFDMFLEASKQGYISDSQLNTARDWLSDPWEFTRRILPAMKSLREKEDAAAAALAR